MEIRLPSNMIFPKKYIANGIKKIFNIHLNKDILDVLLNIQEFNNDFTDILTLNSLENSNFYFSHGLKNTSLYVRHISDSNLYMCFKLKFYDEKFEIVNITRS